MANEGPASPGDGDSGSSLPSVFAPSRLCAFAPLRETPRTPEALPAGVQVRPTDAKQIGGNDPVSHFICDQQYRIAHAFLSFRQFVHCRMNGLLRMFGLLHLPMQQVVQPHQQANPQSKSALSA